MAHAFAGRNEWISLYVCMAQVLSLLLYVQAPHAAFKLTCVGNHSQGPRQTPIELGNG